MEDAKTRAEQSRPMCRIVSNASLIQSRFFSPDQSLPLVVRPVTADVDLVDWACSNKNSIEQMLIENGAILFRGFNIKAKDDFLRFVKSFAIQLMDYMDPHTPRTALGEQIYTSTEYPPGHQVPFHSENSKNTSWPTKLWFFCSSPAAHGGETPLADNRKVFQLLAPALRSRFERQGVMYVRNYGAGLGLSWQSAFRTTDRNVVEEHCRREVMKCEWKGEDGLRLTHTAQAVIEHPLTGEMIWFNQAHLFHSSSLQTEVRRSLLAILPEEDLPSNAYYGDGSPIEDGTLEIIREAYQRASTKFPWQSGDVLMLENMLVSHSRTPFQGPRKILVAMAQPHKTNTGLNRNGETGES